MKVSEIAAAEYNPYYKPYIDKVGEATLLEALQQGMVTTQEFFNAIPSHLNDFQYAEGKWTPKEILIHLIDAERVFCYRALTFARSEDAQLPGFDENVFVENAMVNTRTMKSLLTEYVSVRTATLALFSSFSRDSLQKGGHANNSFMSVRALGFVICGHELHHMKIIQERYLN